MSVKVKICGIRTINAAKAAVNAGVDFLGFNFVTTSKRYLNPYDAVKIINLVKERVKIVGVFQDADINYVNHLTSDLGLDFAQLHGSEDNDYINNVDVPTIKAVIIDDQVEKIEADYLLLDRAKRGEGEMVLFTKSAKLAAKFPIFYAGGLNSDNVTEVIRQVKPYAVDVASGIETEGVQDINKIKKFIKNAKEAAWVPDILANTVDVMYLKC